MTVAQREQLLDERRAGRVVEEHGAGLGDHHGVDHDRRAGLQQAERVFDGADGLRGAEHPDLHGVDADVLCHLPDLLDDHLRRRRVHRADAGRVLRGQRRDRRHPVDAAARERLQVRLDAGAAAGVRAGDREDGGNGRLMPCRVEGSSRSTARTGPRTRGARARAARAPTASGRRPGPPPSCARARPASPARARWRRARGAGRGRAGRAGRAPEAAAASAPSTRSRTSRGPRMTAAPACSSSFAPAE